MRFSWVVCLAERTFLNQEAFDDSQLIGIIADVFATHQLSMAFDHLRFMVMVTNAHAYNFRFDGWVKA